MYPSQWSFTSDKLPVDSTRKHFNRQGLSGSAQVFHAGDLQYLKMLQVRAFFSWLGSKPSFISTEADSITSQRIALNNVQTAPHRTNR